MSSEDSDWKFKMALGKIPVVYLNNPLDFQTWHLSLRRLVSTYNMVPSLMFSVPENKLDSLRKRVEEVVKKEGEKEKREQEREQKTKETSGPRSVSPSRSPGTSSSSTASSIAIDLTGEILAAAPLNAEMKNLMASMGCQL
jgi:hypothetical protein